MISLTLISDRVRDKLSDLALCDGDTALHISIKNGFYESFSLLLKYGVDILIKDDFDMDAYELLDVFRKKEKFYDSNCNKYSIMFNLLIKEKMKGEIRKI
ncbi:hypothetical protein PFFCH_01492 [Plasmodium falciparum FCH/4]|uniref:Uncharacterized protein n=1 Tax=Plasmodium falciparum FCH/4 TaxID=1036724 RepID=A0A024VRX2_PLAFA|nr:hypothetical protein PFFCH_01492 [Plasmodium falciparum FCH/4]